MPLFKMTGKHGLEAKGRLCWVISRQARPGIRLWRPLLPAPFSVPGGGGRGGWLQKPTSLLPTHSLPPLPVYFCFTSSPDALSSASLCLYPEQITF